MKVFSSYSGRKWLSINESISEDNSEEQRQDVALAEIRRVLSDTFRCNNLIILTGLGTSLHVNVDKGCTEPVGDRSPIIDKKIAPTMSDLWKSVKESTEGDFDKILGLAKFPYEDQGENIESLLSYCKIASEFINNVKGKKIITNFVNQAEKIIREKVDFLLEADALNTHSELLRKIARRSNRKTRAKIFTTNYDLCFEYAARQGRYVIVDGFSHTNPQVFDSVYFSYDIVKRDTNPDTHNFINNVFHLYKLHGSIDWAKNSSNNEIERVNRPYNNPILIYPRNTKYQMAFEQPYFEMMAAFQNVIRQPETALVIVGFGFNDSHIAEPVLSAIQSNLSLKVVICDPTLENSSNSYIKKIYRLIEEGDARLALINGTFEQLVDELPDIAAETELEQHMERIRLVQGQGRG